MASEISNRLKARQERDAFSDLDEDSTIFDRIKSPVKPEGIRGRVGATGGWDEEKKADDKSSIDALVDEAVAVHEVEEAVDKIDDKVEARPSQRVEPSKYKEFKSNRKSFADGLKDELEKIGGKYEIELAGIEDKERAMRDRNIMKNIFKTLIDAAALQYMRKHAPGQKYNMTDPAQYEKDMERTDRYIANRQALIKEKFKELRAQTRESFRDQDRQDAHSDDVAYRNFQDRQRLEREERDRQDRKDAAALAHQRRAGLVTVKQAIKDRSGPKPLSEKDRQAIHQQTLRGVESLKKADSLEDVVRGYRNMGMTDAEVSEYTADIPGTFWDSAAGVEDFIKRLPQDYTKMLTARRLGMEAPESIPIAPPSTGLIERKTKDGRIALFDERQNFVRYKD